MKYRQLKAILRARGYTCRPGKGSHSIWTHPAKPSARLVLAGDNGAEVHAYQLARQRRQSRQSAQPWKPFRTHKEVNP